MNLPSKERPTRFSHAVAIYRCIHMENIATLYHIKQKAEIYIISTAE